MAVHIYKIKGVILMSKVCFIIMPFGGASQALKRQFDGVYKGIIVPAVQEAGYEAVREDIA